MPNTGASPNGPVCFDVNVHSLLSVLNRSTNLDVNQTINIQRAVADQTSTPKPHRAVQVQITGEARPPARAQRSRFGAVGDLHAPDGASGDPQDDAGKKQQPENRAGARGRRDGRRE